MKFNVHVKFIFQNVVKSGKSYLNPRKVVVSLLLYWGEGYVSSWKTYPVHENMRNSSKK